MFDDDERDELDATPEEIEDLDAPDETAENVKGGARPPQPTATGCTCVEDCQGP